MRSDKLSQGTILVILMGMIGAVILSACSHQPDERFDRNTKSYEGI
jgi:uncharacterized membrane protein YeaQ/YmgE (transglycosylase-associated protein family)